MNEKNDESGQLHQEENRLVELMCQSLLRTAQEQNSQKETNTSTFPGGRAEFSRVLYAVLGRFRTILAVSILCAVFAGVFAFYILEPTYAATSKLYIMGENSNSILSDLQVGTYLTMDYQEVFKTWEVHDKVLKKLDLPYSYKEMQSMLDISNPSNTRVLYITVKNKDPLEAMSIANAYAEAAKAFIIDTMDSEAPSTFSLALVPGKATGISRGSYILLGFLLGLLGTATVLAVRVALDNHPKTPEDIMKCAGIPTLAIMPTSEPRKKKKHRAGRK